MEKVEEYKYACKLCTKSFPSGRSFGGHMKSHVINDHKKTRKTKLKSINNFCLGRNPGYSLGVNPNKSFPFSNSKVEEKLCKFSNTLNENSDCSISVDRKPVLDVKHDSEFEVLRKKKKRSKRHRDRYDGNILNSCTVTEPENEQEEVALCLIMLSKDLGSDNNEICSVDESSDNNFKLVEVGSSDRSTKIEKNKGECSLPNVKFKTMRHGELKFTERARSCEGNQSDCTRKEKVLSDCIDGDEHRHISTANVEIRSIKRNVKPNRNEYSPQRDDSNENHRDLSNKASDGNWDIEMHKKSNFECTRCNKSFLTYQALGGHRASHDKIKGCFGTKVENNNDGVDLKIVTNLTHNPKCKPLPKSCASKKKKKSKANFECPVCFKVFSSGQALGGHKRSHLIASVGSKSNSTSTIQIPEVRDFLDLNLPASTEDEEDSNGFKPWCPDSSGEGHGTPIGLFLN